MDNPGRTWTRAFTSLSPGRREVLKAAAVWLGFAVFFPLAVNGTALLFHQQRMWTASIIFALIMGAVMAFTRLWRLAR